MASAQVMSAGAFCTNLDELEEKTLSMLEQRASRAQTRTQERTKNYDDVAAARLMQLDRTRLEADGVRTRAYENLNALAQTDAQQRAVEAFEAGVEVLVRERRAAVDDAIGTFEGNMADMYEEYSVETNDFIEEIQAAIIAAFDAAQDGCDGSASPTEVRNELRDTLQAIRDEYDVRREGYNYREQLEQHREVRNQAVEAAMSTFREAYEAEKERLRQAFGE
jgi:hypothetical protein